jgi:hypothetical protein
MNIQVNGTMSIVVAPATANTRQRLPVARFLIAV